MLEAGRNPLCRPSPKSRSPSRTEHRSKHGCAGRVREVVLAIAVRAALRVAPLAVRITRKGLGPARQRELTLLTGRIFRALALAQLSAQDPNRTFSPAARTAAGAASEPTVLAIVAAEEAMAAMFATSAAANSAASAAAANPHIPATAAAAVDAFVKAVEAADANTSAADAAAWSEVRSDIGTRSRVQWRRSGPGRGHPRPVCPGPRHRKRSMVKPREIKDRASLEAWLRKQPREVAATIAARVALRVAPLIGGASNLGP